VIRKILWISGVLAAIAVFIRGSVVLGLYLLILPGLILAVAPTVFLYTGAFELLRKTLRGRLRIRPVAVNALAAALTVAAGVAVAAPAALSGRRAFQAAAKADVDPSQPVSLEGDVRLDRSVQGRPVTRTAKDQNACDELCAALLDTPGVRSVTIGGTDASGVSAAPVTYRLIPKSQAHDTTLTPADPAEIVDLLPPDDGKAKGRQWRQAIDDKKALRTSVIAKWSLRLAQTDSLVSGSPPATFDRTIAIRDLPARGLHRIAVTEVEIMDSTGNVLLRQQRVTGALVATLFFVVPSGPMLDRGFEIGRRTVHTGPKYFDFKPVETLFRKTALARPAADAQAVVRLRDSFAASATAAAGAAHFDAAQATRAVMVAPWLATLDWQHLSDADVDVLAGLIADPRTTGLERLYAGSAKHVSPRLRRPIAIRLVAPATDDPLRHTLNTLVRNMPAGTYARLLPEEKSLLADRELRLRSSALVARLADQGPDAVPLLLDILNQDVTVQPWAKRHWILADIRRAFSALGRDAGGALPTVERLFDLPRSPLTNSSNDYFDWRVAMVRMGKPVETLAFPANMKPEVIARDREQIRRQAEKGPECSPGRC
jgi:hypothetical protein